MISIHLSLAAEREVPVMLRIMLRSAFSSMYIIIVKCRIYEYILFNR